MNKTTKILITIAIIAILAVLAFVFWPAEPVNDDQNNNQEPVTDNSLDDNKYKGEVIKGDNGWSSYYNEKLGFSFKHPEGWTNLNVSEYNRIHFYSDGIIRNKFEMMDSGEVTIFYNLLDIQDGWYKKTEKQEDITIDGYDATKYINVPAGQDRSLPSILTNVVVVPYKDKNFMIIFETERYSTYEDKLIPTVDKDVFENILQTFKFFK